MKCKCPSCGFEFQSKGNTLKILEKLKKGDMNISELCKELELSRPVIYHHLNKLKEQNLVVEYFGEGKGKPHFFSLIGKE